MSFFSLRLQLADLILSIAEGNFLSKDAAFAELRV